MIRFVCSDDWPAVHEIMAHYIRHSTANLGWEVPGYARFVLEQQEIAAHYPYYVAVHDDRIIGFGYTHRFLAKEAYQFDAEVTIYFAPGNHHGLVEPLYRKLEDKNRELGIRRLIGCTTASNQASLAFQKRMGYEEYGRLKEAGYKNGEWHDVVWTQKLIAPLKEDPQPIKTMWGSKKS